ncbi:MAG: TIGR00159 family protein [Lachnospiraceae bacterium]|nr:TIGR00159 family protein [Lachnospiraceae bacterium]
MENLTAAWKKIVSLLSLPNMKPMDFVEIVLIAVLVYYVITWIQKTRAWVIVKGLVVLVLFWIIASVLKFDVILWIFTNTIGVGITALIILFQPELRRVLEQLGQRNIIPMNFFSPENKDKKAERFSSEVLNELVRGTFELAKTKTGALIVIEQDVTLEEYSQTGIEVDGLVTSQLLINIFEHNTPLHDGAVIVRGNRVASATCYLPLSGNMRLSKDLGTRHRAAVGISEVTDSFTIVVSEETGKVSIARDGNLIYNVDGDFLRSKLQEIQKKKEQEPSKTKKVWDKLKGKGRHERKTDK